MTERVFITEGAVSAEQWQLFQRMLAQHGDDVLLRFDTIEAARAYAATKHGWSAYGLRRNNVSWYHVRPGNDARTAPTTKAEGAPTGPSAKSTCLSLYRDGIDKETFVMAAVASGVKETTARTMFSDIKAGRIK